MPEPNASPDRHAAPSSALPPHVLVVDDEEMMRAMLARELPRLGFQVTAALKRLVCGEVGSATLVAKSASMQALLARIDRVAPTDAAVLIQGESGTGKELVARLIHGLSARRAKPFVVINCSAIPDTLFE